MHCETNVFRPLIAGRKERAETEEKHNNYEAAICLSIIPELASAVVTTSTRHVQPHHILSAVNDDLFHVKYKVRTKTTLGSHLQGCKPWNGTRGMIGICM